MTDRLVCRVVALASLAAILGGLVSPTPAGSDGDLVLAKLRAQAQRQLRASQAKPLPAARGLPSAIVPRPSGKLVDRAHLRALESSRKRSTLAEVSGPSALLGKLRAQVRRQAAAHGDKGATLPRPALRSASLQQDESPVLTYGDTVTAVLGDFVDQPYRFTGAAGDIVDIALSSDVFDTYLRLQLDGEDIAIDDDGGGELNSLIGGFALPAAGEYTVVATSFDGSGGDYLLSLRLAGSLFAFGGSITAGTTTGELAADGQVGLYHLAVDEFSQLAIGLTSDAFDTYFTCGFTPAAPSTPGRPRACWPKTTIPASASTRCCR
jgi:hypothetical protein